MLDFPRCRQRQRLQLWTCSSIQRLVFRSSSRAHRHSRQQTVHLAVGRWVAERALACRRQHRHGQRLSSTIALSSLSNQQRPPSAAAAPRSAFIVSAATAVASPGLQTAAGKTLVVSDDAHWRAAAFFDDDDDGAAARPANTDAETDLAADSMQQRSEKPGAPADAQLCAVKRNSTVASPVPRPKAKSGGASPFTPLRPLQACTNLAAACAAPGRTAPRTASGVKPVLGRRGSPQKTPLTARRPAVRDCTVGHLCHRSALGETAAGRQPALRAAAFSLITCHVSILMRLWPKQRCAFAGSSCDYFVNLVE